MAANTDKSGLFSFAWRAMAPPDLPAPVAEYTGHGIPGRKFRFDFAWPELRVVVEVDGGVWKVGGGKHGSDSDRERNNLCVLYDWHVLRFSTHQLEHDPAACVILVAKYLRKRLAETEK